MASSSVSSSTSSSTPAITNNFAEEFRLATHAQSLSTIDRTSYVYVGPNQKALIDYLLQCITNLGSVLNLKDLTPVAQRKYTHLLGVAKEDLEKTLNNDQSDDYYANALKQYGDTKARARAVEQNLSKLPWYKKLTELNEKGTQLSEEEEKEYAACIASMKDYMVSNKMPNDVETVSLTKTQANMETSKATVSTKSYKR